MKNTPLIGLILLAIGCRTSAPPSEVAGSSSELTASPAACEETCGSEYASAKLVGCVVSCDIWRSDKVTILKGRSIYALRKSEPGCSFVYTKRDSNQIRMGSAKQSFSYSFAYTKGIGDGDFIIIGSEMTDQANLIDFTKIVDKKEIKRIGSTSAMDLEFNRSDSAYADRPTFSLTGDDIGEFKQLTIVLDKDFDPKRPFKKIVSTKFQAKIDSEVKHEIECGR